ncbi:hypothetical protein ABZ951_00755 [Streptomyces sp. NPDC046215]|uniref:Uncharacterized protein n=1 Tax=Streptomyces stramineus TaxID=173861 RepID=A0ABN0ZNK3_9ACTN
MTISLWTVALFAGGLVFIVSHDAIERRRRNRRVQAAHHARAADRTLPVLPEEAFLLGHEPLDDAAITDQTALGIQEITAYLAKEAER